MVNAVLDNGGERLAMPVSALIMAALGAVMV
jgi:hypothetical protein